MRKPRSAASADFSARQEVPLLYANNSRAQFSQYQMGGPAPSPRSRTSPPAVPAYAKCSSPALHLAHRACSNVHWYTKGCPPMKRVCWGHGRNSDARTTRCGVCSGISPSARLTSWISAISIWSVAESPRTAMTMRVDPLTRPGTGVWRYIKVIAARSVSIRQ